MSTLTSNEIDVLSGVARGLSYKQIAQEMGRSDSTVRTHVHNTILKLGAHDGMTAVLAWLRSPERLAPIVDELHAEHGGDRDKWAALVARVAGTTFDVEK